MQKNAPPPELSNGNILDMVRDLIGMVAENLSFQVSQHTKSFWRAHLAKIERAVAVLNDAMRPLRNRHRYWRDHDGRIRQYVIREIDDIVCDLYILRVAKLDSESLAIAYWGGVEVLKNPDQLLDAIVDDARDWAGEQPELARANDPNAVRLMFIRNMTAYFRERYEQPLRGCVLAITSVFLHAIRWTKLR
ncbi:hypothetical protein [Xanthomonas albilineans]|uniref:hypothetical protein n=1 Tax=Xanthomonas albilineans TaxID=29447 RepID=UPI0011AFDED5|nr:hypothetical protein [Xanthomonas albilineans]